MEKTHEQNEISRCVDNGLNAWADGAVSIQEVRELHGRIGELNRRAATETDFDGDVTALRFMHQVTKGLAERLKTTGRQTGVRHQYKSAKRGNSDDV